MKCHNPSCDYSASPGCQGYCVTCYDSVFGPPVTLWDLVSSIAGSPKHPSLTLADDRCCPRWVADDEGADECYRCGRADELNEAGLCSICEYDNDKSGTDQLLMRNHEPS